MKLRKFGVRTAMVGLLAAVATGVAGPGVASACEATVARSESASFARTLPQVRPGQSGPAVVGLQLALRGLGYPLRGTGYYGVITHASVKDYQRKHGINASGIVGAKIWQALVGSLPEWRTNRAVFTVPMRGLRPGDRDRNTIMALIGTLQRIHPYQEKATRYGSDVYGPELQALVRDFQRRAGIRDSGIVGPKTWFALNTVVSVEGGWGC